MGFLLICSQYIWLQPGPACPNLVIASFWVSYTMQDSTINGNETQRLGHTCLVSVIAYLLVVYLECVLAPWWDSTNLIHPLLPSFSSALSDPNLYRDFCIHYFCSAGLHLLRWLCCVTWCMFTNRGFSHSAFIDMYICFPQPLEGGVLGACWGSGCLFWGKLYTSWGGSAFFTLYLTSCKY